MPDHTPRPRGVIFDMDGLMLDTETIARICWDRAFARAGHEMPEAFSNR